MLITLLIAILIGGFCGIYFQKKHYQSELEDARNKANQIIQKANVQASRESHKIEEDGKRKVLEYQESIMEELDSFIADNQIRKTRIDQRQKGQLQTEQRLDTFGQNLEELNDNLDQLHGEISAIESKSQKLVEKRSEILQERGRLSKAEARTLIFEELNEELQREADIELRYLNDEAVTNASKKARMLAEDAIERGPVDLPREHIEHSVLITDNETKRKLVGHDAQNIRYVETLTGTDLVFDEQDDNLLHVVTQDPIRRETARLSLSNLLITKQITPASIEQQVQKAQDEVNANLRKSGEQVVASLHIGWMHPDLLKILGRLKYRTSYGQNVLNHSIEVAQIAGVLAAELGIDVKMAKRAGLLHDIGKAIDHEVDGTHVELGVILAETYGEDPTIINAIAAHHGDVDVQTPIADLIEAGDSISGGRPGARSESVEDYVNRLKGLEKIANQHIGVKDSYAIQAGREIRILVDPKIVDDSQNKKITTEVKNQIENELTYPGKIKVTTIRDFRAIAYVGDDRRKKRKFKVAK